MFELDVNLINFLSVKKAEIRSKNNITILIAPNKAGKTQIMLMLYSIFWSLWKISKDKIPEERIKKAFEDELRRKIKNVFLIKNLEDISNWNDKNYSIKITSDIIDINFNTSFNINNLNIKSADFFNNMQSPIYLQLSGLGDYYKGIYSLKKYYPHWKLTSESILDLISDIFLAITSAEDIQAQKKNQELLNLFETFFGSRFYIQDERIYIYEKEKKYSIEKAASGLKSLSWFYLILKYDLIGNIIFIDEPEVNLHPKYIDKLTYFLYKLSRERKIFIATHSDYLLESLNKLMNKHDFKIDVWEGDLKEEGAHYRFYEANKDNLIDTSPLINVYIDILKEGFGYERD